MKINNIDMKEACDHYFEDFFKQSYGQSEFDKKSTKDKAEMKTVFVAGFETVLHLIMNEKDKDDTRNTK